MAVLAFRALSNESGALSWVEAKDKVELEADEYASWKIPAAAHSVCRLCVFVPTGEPGGTWNVEVGPAIDSELASGEQQTSLLYWPARTDSGVVDLKPLGIVVLRCSVGSISGYLELK